MNGTVKAFIFLFVLMVSAGCSGADGTPTATGTSAPTVTLIPSEAVTRTPPPTATSIQQPTPTPLANAVYYMIVLDSSRNMNVAFDGSNKWDAAKETANAILGGLEPGANYGLVVIGGSPSAQNSDPCSEPSVALLPFSTKSKLNGRLDTLEADGSGSISTAYALAQSQITGLPGYTIRVLIYITGTTDGCKSRDEWSELGQQLDFNASVNEDFYSEIIVVNEEPNPVIQKLANRYGKPSDNVDFQFLQGNAEVSEVTDTVLANVSRYVDDVVATRPTESALVSSFTLTPGTTTVTYTPTITSTPTLTSTPTITATPSVGPTSTITSTWTPSATPYPTFTAAPSSVSLLAVNYLTSGVGCQVDVQMQVNESNAIGVFHVRNDSMGADGVVSSSITLQTGTNWLSALSVSNLLTLPGDQPQYYLHEIWFEYNGIETNHLEGLICPGLFLPH